MLLGKVSCMRGARRNAPSQALLGLGGAVDWEMVWDAELLTHLAAELDVRPYELDGTGRINGYRDLVVSIVSHVCAGTGGEFFANNSVLSRLGDRVDYRVGLGGTGVRAALALASIGLESTVHLSTTSREFERLLPSEVNIISGSRTERQDPHLVVQFPENAAIWIGGEEFRAPASNRLIYTGDRAHQKLRLSDDLRQSVSRAEIVLLSGFNSVTGEAEASSRVREVRRELRERRDGATVIYEDAAFHFPELSGVVWDELRGEVDICSLNEDELMARVGRSVDLLDVNDLSAAILECHERSGSKTLVLHSRYFAIARGADAEWLGEALDNGLVMAGARYACGSGLMPCDYRRFLSDVARRRDAADVVRGVVRQLGDNTVGVAGFDLRGVTSPTTIGLGDTFIGGVVAGLLGVPDDDGERSA